jgi:hypothetical protein
MSTAPKKQRPVGLYVLIAACMILGGGYIFSLIVVSRLYNHIAVVQQELLVQIELERHVRDTTGLLAELRGVGDAITTYFKTPNDVIAVIEGIEGFKKTDRSARDGRTARRARRRSDNAGGNAGRERLF